ncbi:2-dehydropantoate 2-reductase [Piscinibacter sp. HJYY11]|uniref:2-dehydropantoate 2-reductase n=1 Tax=Piscinibacter sp. HJYY11 TaxID=2801333 RepID=UPI00191E49EA|nr:2-dehydropantoate 2-reductase [Piscinibacter sp. HJYY11]MBL0728057.1 2-dehydropantoate 2-reductase [Piscinibacter sp. HJYY11]
MKITVAGLGAVGGLIAAKLALAGHEVSAVARGRTLQAVRDHGLVLRMGGQEQRAAVRASDNAGALGPQDVLVIALKGQSLPDAAASFAPLIAPHTLVVPAMNGVPWWFLQTPALQQRLSSAERQLRSVDPHGTLGAALPVEQVLGCVVHLTCSQPEPGVVQHGFGDRLIFGEPAGGTSDRLDRLAGAFGAAGFKVEASTDIRREIWFKLWGNMTTNPVSALTGATADRILDDPLVRSFMLRAMAEAAEVGAQIGCPIAQSGEERLTVTRQLGAFKTSMLQDSEANRPLEIDAIVTAVHEIGQKLGIATPHIDTVLGLVRLMARSRGLYPPAA